MATAHAPHKCKLHQTGSYHASSLLPLKFAGLLLLRLSFLVRNRMPHVSSLLTTAMAETTYAFAAAMPVAAEAEPTCPLPRNSTSSHSVPCVSAASWSELHGILLGAEADGKEQVVLCPFHVTKGEGDVQIVLRGRLRVFCNGGYGYAHGEAEEEGACVLEGSGSHVRLHGAKADVVLSGLTFKGATDSAIVVLPTATNVAMICGCTFVGNERVYNGGAIRVGTSTNVVVRSSVFRHNIASTGGAIYSRGMLTVVGSTFESNSATIGGAIANSIEAYLDISTSVFLNNDASQLGPAVSVELDENGWNDGGGNVASGNVGCDGVHDANGCNEFVTPHFRIFPSPSVSPLATTTTTTATKTMTPTLSPSSRQAQATTTTATATATTNTTRSSSLRPTTKTTTTTRSPSFRPTTTRNPSLLPTANGQYPTVEHKPNGNGAGKDDDATGDPPTNGKTPGRTFKPGDLSNFDSATGLALSVGLTVRIIAKSELPVRYGSGEATSEESDLPFHVLPDGAIVTSSDDGGWIYTSNSEENKGGGGVHSLRFDSNGEVSKYSLLLGGTTRNCAGGRTPWNTYVSCEEYTRGQCWQVDPTGVRDPEPTKLVESEGGNFEAVANDNRDPSKPVFFVTEDHQYGAIRRYRPNPAHTESGWDMLHTDGGTLDYLEFSPNGDNTFGWTNSIKRGRASAFQHYPNSEGIDCRNGILYFVSKRLKALFVLDLDAGTFAWESTKGGRLFGDGTFSDSPDQLIRAAAAAASGSEKYMFLTEDGGCSALSPGVYVREFDTGNYYTIFEGTASRYYGDETTGVAFSPDGLRMYACMQRTGYLFEFVRDDGLPFDGQQLQLKYH